MFYFKFNIGDYASHTQHLTLIEDMAYRRLLEAYYLSERPLNSGIAGVARQIRMREYEKEVGDVLQEFFYLSEKGWAHARADREIAEFHWKIKQASDAGRASAIKRLSGRSTDVQPTTNHEPLTKNQEPETIKQERMHPARAAKSRESGADAPPFILPDWIDTENWNAWHSSGKRKKATNDQKQVAVNILAKWRSAGMDYAGALENAAAGGYQGLFLPDGKPKGYETETTYQRSMRERVDKAIGRNQPTTAHIPFLEIEQ